MIYLRMWMVIFNIILIKLIWCCDIRLERCVNHMFISDPLFRKTKDFDRVYKFSCDRTCIVRENCRISSLDDKQLSFYQYPYLREIYFLEKESSFFFQISYSSTYIIHWHNALLCALYSGKAPLKRKWSSKKFTIWSKCVARMDVQRE